MADTFGWLGQIPEAVATALVAAFVTLAVRWWDRRKAAAEAASVEGNELRAIIASQREYIDSLEAELARRRGAESDGGSHERAM